VGVYASERAPAEIGRQHIAIGVVAVVLQSDDEPFGVMGTPVQSGTTHDGHHLVPTADADRLWRTGMGDKIVGHVLLARVPPDSLITTPLADDLSSTEEGRCSIHKGSAPIEGISDEAVHVEGRLGRVAWFQQA